jgi:hypothetical protein
MQALEATAILPAFPRTPKNLVDFFLKNSCTNNFLCIFKHLAFREPPLEKRPSLGVRANIVFILPR